MAKLTPWQLLATGLLVFLFQSVLLQNQVDNKCRNMECGENALCMNVSGNFSCSCKIGYWKKSNQKKTFLNSSENDCDFCDIYETETRSCKKGYKTCSGDPDSCCVDSCQHENCGKYALCIKDCGDVLCECKPGFHLPNGGREFKSINENNCEDIDECKRNVSICGPKGSCINTQGDYHCKCKQGYGKSFKDDRKLCRDIDECNGSYCDATAHCYNSEGNYSCYCPEGYFQYSNAVQEDKTKIKCKEFNFPMPSWNDCSDEQSFLCNITTQLGNLFGSLPNVSSQMDSKKHLRETLDTLDNLLNLMEAENKEQSHQVASKVMQVMETWLRMFAFALPNGTTTIKSKAGTELAMEIRTADNTSQDLAQLWLNETQLEVSWEAASKTEEGPSVVGLLSYQNLGCILTNADIEGSDWEQIGKSKQLMEEPGKPNYKVLSKVASAFVGHNETAALSSNITVTFNHPKPELKPDLKVICAFWKPTNRGGHWSQEGCVRLNSSTANRTYCRCKHMTSFAVLMAFYDIEDWTLSVITKVGLVVSLICLFFSILTFLFCRAIQGIRTTIHFHLCLSLFAAHVIFLCTGISRNTTACVVIAGLLHYSFLCVFCWMLLEGVQLYVMVVQVFNTHSLKHWHIFLVGYGFPAVLVGISAAINSKGYSSRNCWLSRERGFLWSFLGPVSFIIMVNAVVFLITVWRLSEKFADINPDLTKLKKQRVLTITAIAQLCILGITWIFGLFQFSNQTLVLSYLFTILNSLQGLFIFVLHCVLKKQVRDDYYRWLCQGRRGKTQSSDKYSEFSSTSGSNTLRSPKTLKESGM
ncbi:adhesion G protein-coupled receptor E5 isoform X1 [Pantherophis guttatus]|uniref:Adhesion G protein-coupled receptor E5 isoform X1 n=1 Tax=Pantherophis guttatus TaxID=94885 RepID=A0A6P9AWN1_PANGU|nr:adhesion G protein-coupled receptor E5 isoform X1 [Pantherophis guttatus]